MFKLTLLARQVVCHRFHHVSDEHCNLSLDGEVEVTLLEGLKKQCWLVRAGISLVSICRQGCVAFRAWMPFLLDFDYCCQKRAPF